MVHGSRVGMREPFLVRAHHAAAHARLVEGRLEIEGVPFGYGLRNRLRVELAAEQLGEAAGIDLRSREWHRTCTIFEFRSVREPSMSRAEA